MRAVTPVLAVTLALYAFAATAATYTVGNTADIPDALPGDGKCSFILNHPNPGDPGQCTLRAAIMETNATATHDTIVLAAGATYLLAIPGRDEDNAATGDLDIRRPVTLSPPLFWGVPTGMATINANGLDRVFDVNTAQGGVTLSGLILRGGDFGGDFYKNGAGIQLINTLANFSFLDVDTNLGTGISVWGQTADVTLTHATISAHSGESAITADFQAQVVIERSSLINAELGIFVRSNAVAHVNESTISGHDSYGIQALFSGKADLRNVTIANNGLSGVFASGDGSLVAVADSLFASNHKSCRDATGSAVLVMTRNVFDDDTCPNSGAPITTLYNVPVFLSLLGDHGGWTPTHRPMVNSPALDWLTGAECTGEHDDQRLMPRAVDFRGEGPKCDAGAVELETDVIFFDQVDRL